LNNPYILKLSWLQVKQKLLHSKMIAMLANEEPANGIISASVK